MNELEPQFFSSAETKDGMEKNQAEMELFTKGCVLISSKALISWEHEYNAKRSRGTCNQVFQRRIKGTAGGKDYPSNFSKDADAETNIDVTVHQTNT